MEDKEKLVIEKGEVRDGPQGDGSKEIKIVINDGSDNGGIELESIRTNKGRGQYGTDPP
jgi:hypothetical protein